MRADETKKIEKADVVVGVQKPEAGEGPLVVTRTADPNVTHPLRQKDVIEKLGTLDGRSLTSYVFQAVAWKYGLKGNTQFCWQSAEGVLTKYSHDLIAFLKGLTSAQISKALTDYRSHLTKPKSRKK